jgi:hypothetical protein
MGGGEKGCIYEGTEIGKEVQVLGGKRCGNEVDRKEKQGGAGKRD